MRKSDQSCVLFSLCVTVWPQWFLAEGPQQSVCTNGGNLHNTQQSDLEHKATASCRQTRMSGWFDIALDRVHTSSKQSYAIFLQLFIAVLDPFQQETHARLKI